MIRYVAFLRAINVGGKNIIKMQKLRSIFELLGYKNVKTLIQSGNVIFDANEKSEEKIVNKIEKELHKHLTKDVLVFLRTYNEVEEIIKFNPFAKIKTEPGTKLYVNFIKNELKDKPKLPVYSPKREIKIIEINNREIYCIVPVIKGRSGFTNNFSEEYFKIPAASRSWNTVQKIISF